MRLPCAQFAMFSLQSGPPQSVRYTVMLCLAASSTVYCSMIDTSVYALRQAKLMQLLFFKMGSGPLAFSASILPSTALEVLPSLAFSASILQEQRWKFAVYDIFSLDSEVQFCAMAADNNNMILGDMER